MLNEWHLDPNFILQSWTDEQLELYLIKRNERIEKQQKQAEAD